MRLSRSVVSLTLAISLATTPVTAADFSGWDEENKGAVYDIYSATAWSEFGDKLDVTKPANSAQAVDIHKDVRKLEGTVEAALKANGDDLQYDSSEYTELILAMIEVLGHQGKKESLEQPDVCNYAKFIDSGVKSQITDTESSVNYLVKRFVSVEKIYGRYYDYSLYKNNASLKGLIQSVIYGHMYARTSDAGKYTKEKSKAYKDKHEDTLKGTKEAILSTFAEQVSSYYNVSMCVETSTGGSGDIISEARKYIGNKYVWGGNSLTSGIDCSHYVWQILKRTGHNPGDYVTSGGWAAKGTKVNSISEAQAGDVLVWNGHVAFYLGNGQGIIHASNSAPYPKGGIKISKMKDSAIVSFHGGLVAIRRF